MKFIFKILVFLFLIESAHSQQDTTFNKIYSPFGGSSEITTLIKDSGFYYAVFPQVDTPTLIQNLGIIKFDSTGVIVDSNLYCFNNNTVYPGVSNNLIKSGNDDFLLAGEISDSLGESKGYLIKINKNLDTLWARFFSHPDTLAASQSNPYYIRSYFTAVKETPDKGYILTGIYNKNCNGNVNRCFLLKTDSNGTIEHFNTIPYDALTYDVEITKDSGYLYLASYTNKLELIKAYKNGNTQWSYTLSNLTHASSTQDIEFLNDSIIIIGTSIVYTNPPYYNFKPEIFKYNLNSKSIIWKKSYYPATSFESIVGQQYCMTVNTLNEYEILISGNGYLNGIYNGRGILMKLNQNGDSLWCRWYSHENDDSSNVKTQLNDLVVCDDGGFLFGGMYKNYNLTFTKCWLVKTDSNGYVPGVYTLSVKENELVVEKKQITIFPNPANESINLRFSVSPQQATVLSIYSLEGKLVKQEQLPANENQYRINIEELKSGVYIIQIQEGNKMVYNGKFVKE